MKARITTESNLPPLASDALGLAIASTSAKSEGEEIQSQTHTETSVLPEMVQNKKTKTKKSTGSGQRVPLSWLRQPPQQPSPTNFLKLVERIEYIRLLGLNGEAVRQIHQNRRMQLAREGAKSSPQRLLGLEEERRYATLVVFLLELAEQLTDQALQRFWQKSGQVCQVRENLLRSCGLMTYPKIYN